MTFLLWAIPAFVLGSFIEWAAHRFILHNFNIKKFSKYHFGRHHSRARKNMGYDEDYLIFPPRKWKTGLHEIFSLIVATILVLPLAFISIWLWIFLCLHACAYFYLHRRMHLETEWGEKWFPWHYRHHMGKDQNTNWGVTNPMFDYVFNTVKK